jgi:hypothetical protein
MANVGNRLDRDRIEQAFRIMGQYLLDRKALGEIAIYGGSAILFQFSWRKTSEDVDARVISDGNHGLVIEAVREAARQLDLRQSWLSESVSVYTRPDEGIADRVFVGVYPSPERFGLRVTAAKPAYILAMKLKALERTTTDDREASVTSVWTSWWTRRKARCCWRPMPVPAWQFRSPTAPAWSRAWPRSTPLSPTPRIKRPMSAS